MLIARDVSDIGSTQNEVFPPTSRVLGICEKRESSPSGILLGEWDDAICGLGHKIDNIDEFTGLSVNETLVPVIFILNLNDMSKNRGGVVLDEILGLDGPGVPLSPEMRFSKTDGLIRSDLGSTRAGMRCETATRL